VNETAAENWWEMSEPAPVLRDFQAEALENLRGLVRQGLRRLILQSPTGSGKTVMAAHLVRSSVAKGRRVLFLAHRRELIHQAGRKLRSLGVAHGVIMAGRSRTAAACQVASKDTIIARVFHAGTESLPPADLVVVDECHRSLSTWWQKLLALYPRAVVLGLTATPARGDGRGLGDYYDGMVSAARPSRLLAERYLVPTLAYAPTLPDLGGVKVSNGDYVRSQLEKRMDNPKLVGDVVEHWLRLAAGRLTLVFASGVAHSQHLREQFADAGVSAAHVDGTMEAAERDAILADFTAGRTRVLCNCDVFTEGTDVPPVSCAVLARPTKSRVKFLQMAGRIQRPHPGKENALLIDHSGAVHAHGFPDDDIEWVLTPGRGAVALPSGERPPIPPRICPACSYTFKGPAPCPACGTEMPTRRRSPADMTAGQLQAVERGRGPLGGPDRTPAGQQKYWLRCLAVAAHGGRTPKAAQGMFRSHYGAAPDPKEVGPYPKDDQWDVPVAQLWPGFLRGRKKAEA
jgi:DNA repair protein RadD